MLRMKISMVSEKTSESGPCVNRTRDQRIKSPLLYLTELTAHTGFRFIEIADCNCFALANTPFAFALQAVNRYH